MSETGHRHIAACWAAVHSGSLTHLNHAPTTVCSQCRWQAGGHVRDRAPSHPLLLGHRAQRAAAKHAAVQRHHLPRQPRLFAPWCALHACPSADIHKFNGASCGLHIASVIMHFATKHLRGHMAGSMPGIIISAAMARKLHLLFASQISRHSQFERVLLVALEVAPPAELPIVGATSRDFQLHCRDCAFGSHTF